MDGYLDSQIKKDCDQITNSLVSTESNFLMGISFYKNNRIDEAKIYFLRSFNKNIPEASIYLGLIEENSGNLFSAENYYMKAIFEHISEANFFMGNLEYKKLAYKKAIFFHAKCQDLGILSSRMLINHLIEKENCGNFISTKVDKKETTLKSRIFEFVNFIMNVLVFSKK